METRFNFTCKTEEDAIRLEQGALQDGLGVVRTGCDLLLIVPESPEMRRLREESEAFFRSCYARLEQDQAQRVNEALRGYDRRAALVPPLFVGLLGLALALALVLQVA